MAHRELRSAQIGQALAAQRHPVEIQRCDVLNHQNGVCIQTLPGRVTAETLLQGRGPHQGLARK